MYVFEVGCDSMQAKLNFDCAVVISTFSFLYAVLNNQRGSNETRKDSNKTNTNRVVELFYFVKRAKEEEK